jgi:hypothetical protein
VSLRTAKPSGARWAPSANSQPHPQCCRSSWRCSRRSASRVTCATWRQPARRAASAACGATRCVGARQAGRGSAGRVRPGAQGGVGISMDLMDTRLCFVNAVRTAAPAPPAVASPAHRFTESVRSTWPHTWTRWWSATRTCRRSSRVSVPVATAKRPYLYGHTRMLTRLPGLELGWKGVDITHQFDHLFWMGDLNCAKRAASPRLRRPPTSLPAPACPRLLAPAAPHRPAVQAHGQRARVRRAIAHQDRVRRAGGAGDAAHEQRRRGSERPRAQVRSGFLKAMLQRDQLLVERAAGRVMHDFAEAPIEFPPTFKVPLARRDGSGGWTRLNRLRTHRWSRARLPSTRTTGNPRGRTACCGSRFDRRAGHARSRAG